MSQPSPHLPPSNPALYDGFGPFHLAICAWKEAHPQDVFQACDNPLTRNISVEARPSMQTFTLSLLGVKSYIARFKYPVLQTPEGRQEWLDWLFNDLPPDTSVDSPLCSLS